MGYERVVLQVKLRGFCPVAFSLRLLRTGYELLGLGEETLRKLVPIIGFLQAFLKYVSVMNPITTGESWQHTLMIPSTTGWKSLVQPNMNGYTPISHWNTLAREQQDLRSRLTAGFHFVSHRAWKLSWCEARVFSLSWMKNPPLGAAIVDWRLG